MIPPEIKLMISQFISDKWKIAVIVFAAVIVGYLSLIWLPKDNPIEKEVEEIIKEETGLTVDLTP